MKSKKALLAGILGLTLLGLGTFAARGVQKAGTRARLAVSHLSGEPARGHGEVQTLSKGRGASLRDPKAEVRVSEAERGEGDLLAEVPASALGLPESVQSRYGAAYLFTGERNRDPRAAGSPDSPGAPAGITRSEAEMVAKEELLLEHYPELRRKVEERRAERTRNTADFEARGNLGPHEFALEELAGPKDQ